MLEWFLDKAGAWGVGVLLGYGCKVGRDHLNDRRDRRAITSFLGFQNGPVHIVHTVMFNDIRQAYDSSTADARTTRIVAQLLEQIGFVEGESFHIRHDKGLVTSDGGLIEPQFLRENLILICGPKRNRVTAMLMGQGGLRYTIEARDSGLSCIVDGKRDQRLCASTVESVDQDGHRFGDDYALILSMPNPENPEKGLVVIAGLHGTGTTGAGLYLKNPAHLEVLAKRRQHGRIQEVLKVRYRDDYENIIDFSLV